MNRIPPGGPGGPAPLADGPVITWATAGAPAPNAAVTLSGNRTLLITGAAAGQAGRLAVRQDATGGRTLALPSGSKTAGGGGVVPSAAAGALDFLTYYYDGVTFHWTILRGFA